MNSRISLKSGLALAALALSLPLAANAQTDASAGTLTCKVGPPHTVVTNTGSTTLLAGTKIVVHLNPVAGSIGALTQTTLRLKSDLAPGLTASLTNEPSGYYQGCTATIAK